MGLDISMYSCRVPRGNNSAPEVYLLVVAHLFFGDIQYKYPIAQKEALSIELRYLTPVFEPDHSAASRPRENFTKAKLAPTSQTESKVALQLTFLQIFQPIDLLSSLVNLA